MFGFIKDKLQKIYTSFTSKIGSLFNRASFDQDFLDELRSLLLSADVGVKTADAVIEGLKDGIKKQALHEPAAIKALFEQLLQAMLSKTAPAEQEPRVLLLVGINGSGKTTFLAKYANQLKNQGKRVLLVAGDTFRAAATAQLDQWAKKIEVPIFIGRDDQDPAAVIFDACAEFLRGGYDCLLIDTAGRLQTKVNLMKELEKIKKVVARQLPQESVTSWLTVDAMLGQNSLRQAEVFHEATQLDGLVLTKYDGTGKGGIVFSIMEQFNLPVTYLTFGEDVAALKRFNAQEYVHALVHDA